VTLWIQSGPPAGYTNEVSIEPYETAELISWPYVGLSPGGSGPNLELIKNGVTTPLRAPSSTSPYPNVPRYVIQGPATFRLSRERTPDNEGYFASLLITPEAFPPDRTLIALPGTNQTSITLECSTNLLDWSSTTNGVYGPMPQAKFFRIKAERLP